jgi:hypothetical protein
MELKKKIFDHHYLCALLAILAVESFSFAGHFFSGINLAAFLIAAILTLIFSLKNLKYGIWIILSELFIGSQGYLLYFDLGSIKISLRIIIWLIVLSVWLKYFIFSIFKKNSESRSIFLNKKNFDLANFRFFVLLFFFIILGAATAFFNGNDWQNIFFDANSWLYFLLIFPFFETFFNPLFAEKNSFLPIWRLLAASATWICFKTFLLFFLFTHIFPEGTMTYYLVTNDFYKWVRDTLIGEITIMPSGFIRVFIQSQIYILITLFLGLFSINENWRNIKNNPRASIFLLSAGAILSGTLIISLSRSFWVGAAAGLIVYLLISIKNYGWKLPLFISLMLIFSILIGIGIVFGTAKFPIPKSSVDFNMTALSDRAGMISGEAAVSSRRALLPILWQKISANPILGSGFGTTVTYQASDPRILKQSSNGLYTTYAFEWGWLDIWLKIGLLGLIAYLLLIGKTIKDAAKNNTCLAWGLACGLLIVSLVSIFSPYTNHPIGIGYLLLAAAVIYQEKNSSCAHD